VSVVSYFTLSAVSVTTTTTKNSMSINIDNCS